MDNKNLFAETAAAIKKAEAAMKVAVAKFDKVCDSLGYTEEEVESMARESEVNDPEIGAVYGVFDGQRMIGDDEEVYPMPANYASKSKLVEGDRMKMTRGPDGSFIYKHIGPVDRKIVDGYLVLDGSQYQVVVDDKSYNVLFASVTFFRAKVGDKVALIIPAEGGASWGAIEMVVNS